MITNQDRKAIRRIFRKIESAIEPDLNAKLDPSKYPAELKMRELVIAQNALRTCMEVVLDECMPIDQHFLYELAVRMACYPITALPIEAQDHAAKTIAEHLPDALARRRMEGFVLRTSWIDQDGERPNIPDKRRLQ